MEAIQFAGRSQLGNLTAVVIDNDSAGLGWPGGIASRFAVEGWQPPTSTAETTVRSDRRFVPNTATVRTWWLPTWRRRRTE